MRPTIAPNEDLYRSVIRATALQPDLATLPRGEQTEIGSRGINLSGGQKARVALARALYKAASDDQVKLVLLDDPFSALDPHVAGFVWIEAVEKLLKGKTIVCALNSNVHLASRADRVILLQDKTVVANGKPNEVFGDLRFAWLFDARNVNSSSTTTAAIGTSPLESYDKPFLPSAASTSSSMAPTKDDLVVRKKELYKGEESKEGAVSWRTYWRWLRAGSKTPLLSLGLILGLYGVTQGVKLFFDLWIGLYVSHRLGNIPVWPYFAAGGSLLFLSLFRALAFANLSAKASETLHNDLVKALLAAPVNLFFDVTPVGRITNRLSSDVDHLDTRLPETVFQLLHSVFTILAALILAIMASPFFILAFIPVGLVFVVVARVFARTSRQIKRLESVSRSPLYSHFGETLGGLSTVRAMKATEDFAMKNVDLVNKNARLHMRFWFASRWFALRVDLIAVVAQVVVCSLVLAAMESINPAVCCY